MLNFALNMLAAKFCLLTAPSPSTHCQNVSYTFYLYRVTAYLIHSISCELTRLTRSRCFSRLDGNAASTLPTEYSSCYGEQTRHPDDCSTNYPVLTSLEHQRCKSLKADTCLQEILSGPIDPNNLWGIYREESAHLRGNPDAPERMTGSRETRQPSGSASRVSKF